MGILPKKCFNTIYWRDSLFWCNSLTKFVLSLQYFNEIYIFYMTFWLYLHILFLQFFSKICISHAFFDEICFFFFIILWPNYHFLHKSLTKLVLFWQSSSQIRFLSEIVGWNSRFINDSLPKFVFFQAFFNKIYVFSNDTFVKISILSRDLLQILCFFKWSFEKKNFFSL